MKDLEDETRDGCQNCTQRNPTTPKRVALTVVGEVHGLEYLAQRPCETASKAEATATKRTRGREPPTHLPYDPCRDRETIPNEHTVGMAQFRYGPVQPSMTLGRLANKHVRSMSQSATHRFGLPSKSSTITTEGPRYTYPSANGSLEAATGYQSFFKKRRLEGNRPAGSSLADPTSARHVANEHSQKNRWQNIILEPRGGNEHQSTCSPPGPLTKDVNIHSPVPEKMNQSLNNSVELFMETQSADPHPGSPSRMFKIPKITPRVNASATDSVELPIRHRPLRPHPGPPSRTFKIPKVTQRVNPPATKPLERPMEYRPANPPPGHPTRPRMLADVDLQRIAAAAHLALESSTSRHRVIKERLQGRDHIANSSSPQTVAAGTIPPPLPPSVEEAYKKKCIELKRRMQEVEESNDVFRVRKARLARGIRKMRLERAYLLEMLGKRMKKNGSSVDGFPQPYDEESDGSSEGPPTVFIPSSDKQTIASEIPR